MSGGIVPRANFPVGECLGEIIWMGKISGTMAGMKIGVRNVWGNV